LPDAAWNQPDEQRQALLDWSTDISFFEGKWFIRGLLGIPFQFQSGRFGWGVWAEVSEETMGRYHAHYHADQIQAATEYGLLANALPEYENTIGLPIATQFGAIELRPVFFVQGSTNHLLLTEQQLGMTATRYHEIVSSISPQSQ